MPRRLAIASIAALFVFALLMANAEDMRTWTRSDGKTAEGVLVARGEKTITIRLTNGAEADIEIASLSLDDQQFVKTWKPKRPISVPEDAVYFNGSWYAVLLEKASWSKARQKAKALDGHLAWVKDEATQKKIAELAEGLRLWLGGTDEEVEGLWKWTDGEKFEYKNWIKGQPDNLHRREHYLHTWTAEAKWNDTREQGPSIVGFIVQWDP